MLTSDNRTPAKWTLYCFRYLFWRGCAGKKLWNKAILVSIPINNGLFISRDCIVHKINRKRQNNALRKRNHRQRCNETGLQLNSSIPMMTSKAITTPTLLIIMDRNSIKGWPTLTWVSSLSGGMRQLQILHVELACYCVKLFALCQSDF